MITAEIRPTESRLSRPARPQRVLVASTNSLLTSVWSGTLASSPGFRLTGTATTLEEAMPLVPHCDVILFGPGAQVEAGVEWVRIVTQTFHDSRILVVGIPHQDHVILAYIEAGACAYVPQDETVERVLQSLEAVVRGEAYVAPEVAPALIGRLARLRQAHIEPDTIGTRLEALTPREREILELVAGQMTNRDIAAHLAIEVGTVKNHVHRILEKMALESRHQAAACLQAASKAPDKATAASQPGRRPYSAAEVRHAGPITGS
jgi:DNA-binding NarL/FixJ family response regulator